uniref:Bucky ball n=1 Tax=Scophthalmus maximus TaxID=52904 RepID=A0A8D3A5S6_SCOMX
LPGLNGNEYGGKQPHPFGGGQPRIQHPRPFFYVQPPSQPYYPYQQWQMNNPYAHYGLPGGFNFNRPCMHPYQYMQYPGFVYPQAPLYPVDYRRMFEPRFHAPPAWGPQQQQHHHPPHQPQGRREMACSEAQTDASDAITKLIECLDKIRASELQGAERELDSGVVSHSSGMFSPGEEKKSEAQGRVLPSVPDGCHLESPAVAFSDSTTAVYDAESSHRSLDALSPQGCWSGVFEEELPLDSSSVHEEYVLVMDPGVPTCDGEELLKSSLAPSSSSSPPSLKETNSCSTASKTEHQAASFDGDESDRRYQILKLPFESILTPGAAGAARLSSPAAPYIYNYLSMQSTHERMSVLSPSLDELSSRDEMFSTDLDDVDLFPKHVYAGRRLAEVVGSSPRAAEEAEEAWLPGSKRFMCACCGKNVAKAAGRGKAHGSTMYRDEAGDSEDDGRYGRGCEQPVRVVVRKHSAPRKPHPVPLRHAAKPWYKRGQHKDPSHPFDQEQGRDLRKQEPADGEMGEVTGGNLDCKLVETTNDRCRPTRVSSTEVSTQRKVMYHRPRDEDHDDDEPPPLHWERG